MKKGSKRSGRKKAAAPRPTLPEAPPAATPAPEELAARPPRPRLSLGKRLVFHAVTVVLFFGFLELILALAGVRPDVVEEDPYVGFSSFDRLYREDGGLLGTAPNKLSNFNDQSFPKRKPGGSFRIFSLGGSTTFGRPFDDATSFSGWLRAYLAAAAPDRKYEVINAGGVSYASYRVAKLMEELVDYDPDLFVIYSGHNEFLERRTYADILAEPEALTFTKSLLQRSRLWALGRRFQARRQRQAEKKYEMTGEVEELLESSAGLDYYFRDEPFRRQVLDHYRFNLTRMVHLARSHGAEVILVTVPVNEKDFSPFKSQHRDGLSEAERGKNEKLLAEAAEALGAGEAEHAEGLAAEALSIDPLYAEGHFLHGRALQALGRYEEAGAAFARAIDEDVCPLRAIEPINTIIFETAEREGVALIDYRRLLRQHMAETAGHRNLGDELFLDHAHPTVEAHGILGRALVGKMAELGFVDVAKGWLDRVGERVAREVEGHVDEKAQAQAYKNLSKVLLWAGKKKEAEKYVHLAEQVLDADWEIRYNEGAILLGDGHVDEAIRSLEEAARIEPRAAPVHDLLGMAYAVAGKVEAAVAEGEKAVGLDPRAPNAWNNLATALRDAGENERALEAIRRAVELDGEYAEAHNSLGTILFDLGRFEEALKSYDRALELRPQYHEALYNRALALGALGRHSEAVAAFDAVLKLDPDFAEAHRGKVQALVAQGRAAAATSSLEALVRLEPGVVKNRVELGNLYMSLGREDDAVAAFRAALELAPNDDRLHHVLATALLITKHFEEGQKHLERALAINPQNPMAANDLATVYEYLGRNAEALELYRRAARLDPSLPGVRESVARLSAGGG